MANTGANDDTGRGTRRYEVAALLIAGASLCLLAQGAAAYFRLYLRGALFLGGMGSLGLCLFGLLEYTGRTTARLWRR